MSNNEEENYTEENADYEASFADYNLAQQEYDETIENPDAGTDSRELEDQSVNDKQTNDDEQQEEDNENSNNSNSNNPDNAKNSSRKNSNNSVEGEKEDNTEETAISNHNQHKEEQPTSHHFSEPVKYDSHSENSNNTDKITEPLSSASASKHDDDERKIFVGGLHWETTVSDLRDYFSKFGKVVDSTLKTDPATGRSRGFGFVLFEHVSAVDKVCAEKSHVLQGKTIDPKRAMSRLNNVTSVNKDPVKKIFVGGVSPDMPEAEIRSFFCKYGKIEEVELPFDRLKNQRRAYVFITFESEKIAEEACANPKQKLGEREVDVRRATPRAENEISRGGALRGRGVYDYSAYYNYGYGYPGYGMPPGYDYSSYYGQDWSQYNQYAQQYAAYPAAAAAAAAAAIPSAAATYGYDYSSWYGQQDPTAAGKVKRGGATSAYHPYSR